MRYYESLIAAGHVGIVYSLTVLKAPGKMRLFSASYDKTIRVRKADVTLCFGSYCFLDPVIKLIIGQLLVIIADIKNILRPSHPCIIRKTHLMHVDCSGTF